MKQRSSYVLIFLFFLLCTVIIGILFKQSFFIPIRGVLEATFLPLQRILYPLTKISNSNEAQQLKEENASLKAMLAKQKDEEREIQALKDQFALSSNQSQTLLPTKIIGRRDDDTFVLDQGSDDLVKKGMNVFVKDSYIGTIAEVTPHLSILYAVSRSTTSITAKTVNSNANGIIKGARSGHMILDHVILSDKLEVGDTVVTKGEADIQIHPLPVGSIIGKIISIDRKSSDLFQKAKIESLIDFPHLETVFILLK